MNSALKLGISSCLLGNKVRFDGGHKLDRWIRDTLGKYVEFVPVCPEAECGLGIPRESMHLEGNPQNPRLVTTRTHREITPRMQKWADKRIADLEKEKLCGFIFKSNSPSSGMARVRVYNEKGSATRTGVGLFARRFMDRFPLMPVEDEGRLHDDGLRENFIERVFVYKRWRDLLDAGFTRKGLIAFHTQHKLLILSHSTRHVTLMGKLVAEIKSVPPKEFIAQYESVLMEALHLKATVKKHCNVLQHAMGYFKHDLSPDEKQELLEVIEQFHKEYVPLIVPVTLINHYVRKYDQPYLREQVYLHPHPVELKLRNHA